jgi:ligand-binding sensor domain-containing protein
MAARSRMTCRRLLWLATWWLPLLAFTIARAELLPTRLYTAADGMASSDLHCVVRDSHGLLWFCTAEGLTSFDGYTFTRYGVSQGLPDAQVADFVEARDGSYWVLTATGISRFLPEPLERSGDGDGGSRFFEVYPFPADREPRPRAPIKLAEASDGRIWCLTTATLFRFDPRSKELEATDTGQHYAYMVMLRDVDGSLWLGSELGMFHRLPDGRVVEYGTTDGLPAAAGSGQTRVGALLRDRDGTLWVGTWAGLCRMSAHSRGGKESVERVYTRRDGLADNVIYTIFQAHDGTIWVATEFGISRFVPGSGETAGRFRTYTARQGLNLPDVGGLGLGPFAEDRRNNIWVVGRGALRLAANGLTTYTVDDGLATNDVQAFFEDRQGRLIAVTGDPRARFFNVFDGDRFVAVKPWLAKGNDFTWGHGQIHFQDHTGAFWVANRVGRVSIHYSFARGGSAASAA